MPTRKCWYDGCEEHAQFICLSWSNDRDQYASCYLHLAGTVQELSKNRKQAVKVNVFK